MVFVDFKLKGPFDRPDFYIANSDDWQDLLKDLPANPGFVGLKDGFIPLWKHELVGMGLEASDVSHLKKRWDKLDEILS